ncbi:hypothetical protein E2C01_092288 [Portunus trituberculatus]|uniref:Uncharacterized protein n=1 Tax=Portunus trituberculatus TaxID=210409 RepID=A0A5B7JG43_PORTR|nr:hypothetical protein [Portunus trituberculatus]
MKSTDTSECKKKKEESKSATSLPVPQFSPAGRQVRGAAAHPGGLVRMARAAAIQRGITRKTAPSNDL